jgi:glycosyltransferase involved in cell wall biosynthesis
MIQFLIPAYNAASSIAKTIASIQLEHDYSILVYNDGSSDDTVAVVNEIDNSAVSLIDNKVNNGYGHAVNALIQASSANQLMIVEADDEVDSEAIDRVLSANLNADIIKCSYHYKNDINDESWTQPSFEKELPSEITTFYDIQLPFINHHPSIWSAIYKASFLKKLRLVEAKGAGWVDVPFVFDSMMKAKSVAWVPEEIYYYAMHNGDNSSTNFDISLPFNRVEDVLDCIINQYNLDVRSASNAPQPVAIAYTRLLLKYIDMVFRIYKKTNEYSIVKEQIDDLLMTVSYIEAVENEEFKDIYLAWNKDGNLDSWLASLT